MRVVELVVQPSADAIAHSDYREECIATFNGTFQVLVKGGAYGWRKFNKTSP